MIKKIAVILSLFTLCTQMVLNTAIAMSDARGDGINDSTVSDNQQPVTPKQVVYVATQNLLGELKSDQEYFSNNPISLEALVEKTLLPVMDSESMSQLILTSHWKQASPEQKKQCVDSLENILVKTYSKVFSYYGGENVIVSDAELSSSGKKSIVRVTVELANLPDLDLDFKLRLKNQQWRIYDVRFQGSSVLKSLRSKYLTIADEQGLVAALKALDQKESHVDRPLRLAATSWTPYFAKGLPGDGVAAELVKEALRRAGYSTHVILVPWKRALSGAKDGMYDAIIATWVNETESENLLYSKPYHQRRIKLIAHRESNLLMTKLEDLKGLATKLMDKSAYSQSFLNGEFFAGVSVSSMMQNLKQVANRQQEAIVADEAFARYVMKGSAIESKLEILPENIAVKDIHLAVSKKNSRHQDIVIAFNVALDSMVKDGTYEKIISRHAL